MVRISPYILAILLSSALCSNAEAQSASQISAADKANLAAAVALYKSKQNDSEAIERFKALARDGVPKADFYLGKMYYHGWGVPQDTEAARSWLLLGANAEETTSMVLLGSLYMGVKGISKDFGQARYWFEKAANLGDANAMDVVGEFYWNGVGVQQDARQALTWFRKSADAGSQNGKEDLAAAQTALADQQRARIEAIGEAITGNKCDSV